MGVDAADYDNDGDLDLFVTNYADDYNTLYRNEGNGTFSDVTPESGMGAVALPYVGWGTAFVDLDLDGWLDLPVANGHLYPQLDQVAPQRQDLFSSRASGFGTAPASDGRGYRQRSLLYSGVGGGRFAEIGERAGTGFRVRDSLSTRGLAAGDLNNDGLVDLVMTSLDEAPAVLVNRTPVGTWLLVKLKGRPPNTGAIGASVRVRAGSRTLRRDVKSGASYQSQSDLRLHVGLAGAATVDEVVVRWPDGRTTRERGLTANRILVLEEPAAP
jgi:hypothetical protein